jgi:hypothetical protein
MDCSVVKSGLLLLRISLTFCSQTLIKIFSADFD